jgi:outer membrane protein OmpA-like peptidoglycan-associated protein
MDDQEPLGFNFWPAFTDFMLAIVLVLILVIGGLYLQRGQINVEKAKKCQDILAASVQGSRWEVLRRGDGIIEIRDKVANKSAILFERDPDDPLLQKVSFQDFVLFESDRWDLKPLGKEVLWAVGSRLQREMNTIMEIQIRGHADIRKSKLRGGNLELASKRANAVFEFLTRDVGIDPQDYSISATSYGEFFPVSRKIEELYSAEKLREANLTDGQMQKNRRIELLLRYRRNTSGCPDADKVTAHVN